MKKANLLKLALLSVFCLALATVNGQNKLSDEAVKVIKELKQVDTKGLSADEAQTVMKVLNLIKRENSPTPEFHQREKVQAAGFTTVRKGDVTTEPIANVDLAVKAVNQGNVLVILDGIEISEEKFKSLDPNSIEKLELRKGETMKVLYGEKAANGVLAITTKQCPRAELKVASTPVAEKPLFILNGKEISEAEFRGLNPNCVADLKLIKGEDAKKEYGEKGANGVLVITTEDCVDQKGLVIVYKGKEISQEEAEQLGVSVECIKASVENVKAYQQQTADAKRLRIAERRQYQATSQQPQVTGFMSVKRGNIDTKSFANKELALQVVEQCQVLIILDGFEISKDKFNSLDANTIESMELKQGESLKIAYGKKATDGVLFIKTKKDGSAKVKGSTPQANIEYVQVLTRADLKPISSCMAGIENINSDELPVISKFKQNGNQVSFRIEVPKTENAKKQKININYTLPNM